MKPKILIALVFPSQINEAQSDSHPTPKGYALMANDIYNYLKNKSLIPCD